MSMSDHEQQPEALEAQPAAQEAASAPESQEPSKPLTPEEWMAANARQNYFRRPGRRVEIRLAVENLKQAEAFYKQLGFAKCDTDVYTDGQIVIHLTDEDDLPIPRLDYYSAWAEFLAVRGIIPPRSMAFATFVDPSGLPIRVSTARLGMPMPKQLHARTPNPRLGTFGQLMIPCQDYEASVAFWRSFTFHLVHTSTDPYPWGILTDKLILIGLHQNSELTEPRLTYYAPDMEAKIQKLQQDGIQVTPVPPLEDGRIRNGMIVAPGGYKILLLEGEIDIKGWVEEADRLLQEVIERENASRPANSDAQDEGEASDSDASESDAGESNASEND